MVNITGSSFRPLNTITNDETVQLDGAAGIATAVLNGVTYVYVASITDDAIQVFTMAADGDLTPVGSVADTGGTTLNGAYDIKTFNIGGTDFLVASGLSDDGITVYSLSDSAPFLTFADREFNGDDANTNLNEPYGLEVVQIGSNTYIYVASGLSNGISVFSVSNSGGLTTVQNIDDADDADFKLNFAISAKNFNLFGTEFLLVSGYADGGVSLFSINSSTGALTSTANFEGDPTLGGAWSADTLQNGNTVYFFVPGDTDSTISVLSYSGGGLITEVQTITSLTNLGGPSHATVVYIADEAYLALHSRFSASIELFKIDLKGLAAPVGSLSPVQSLPNGDGGALSGTRDGIVVSIEGTAYYVASALGSDAINVYEIGGGDDLLEGTQLDDTINGLGGDDLIHGFAGDDSINGGDGTDVILAGSGLDSVTASEGNDRTNGGSGYDTFDARTFDSGSSGVTIDLLNERFILPDGTRQFLTDFERVYATNRDDLLIGDEDNNDLRGGTGEDVIRGRDGRDTLRGQNDADKLYGGDGNDNLLGGYGDDSILNGGDGDDTISGDAGMDSLFGGNGNDYLNGGTENDILRGNAGNDILNGGEGDDDARGGSDDDDVSGGAGDDYISGEAGNDRLNAGDGTDTVLGGSGNDVFEFVNVAGGGGGFNTVKDFTNGEDLLDLTTYGLTFNQINGLMVQRSWGSRIDFADGQIIALEGFQKTDFDSSDLFVV